MEQNSSFFDKLKIKCNILFFSFFTLKFYFAFFSKKGAIFCRIIFVQLVFEFHNTPIFKKKYKTMLNI
ncbi:hypothetical protein BpHYR1_008893 [Brachionus plicatilis]|uniref:Uncharacterized protein n=1 Tax=Brachionus plicatilis TaxID=10195 RepID=A0A3M7T2D3_BRAPC|nr:hypothetical protein BpHYR1_008893 [Brachionus plicatilis]